MTLTPLEIVLSGSLLALLTSVATQLYFRTKYVLKTECCSIVLKMKESFDIIYPMVRELVIHSDMSDADKARVLNGQGQKQHD